MEGRTYKYRVLADIGSLDPSKARRSGDIIELDAPAKNPGGVLELIEGDVSAVGELKVALTVDSAEVQKLLADAQAHYEAGVASLRAEHAKEVEQLRGHVADATGALQVARTEIASLRAELDAAKAQAAKAKGAK